MKVIPASVEFPKSLASIVVHASGLVAGLGGVSPKPRNACERMDAQ